MDRCLDTTKATRHQLEEYARQLLLLVNQYEWISHAYVVEFFKKNHWNSLPPNWQQCLQDLTPPEMAESIMTNTTKTRCVWPLSLLAYKATAKGLSVSKVLPSDLPKQQHSEGDMGDLAFCYRLHVKPKKRHEIDNLARVINSTCRSSHTRRVVDVGSGQGHLSRLLSFGYGLSVTSIEAVGCHITGAAKFDRKVQEFIQKKNRKMGDPKETLGNHTAPPEHVVCTVHPQITVKEFVSVIDTSCHQSKEEDTIILERCESTSDTTHDSQKSKLSADESDTTHKSKNSELFADEGFNMNQSDSDIRAAIEVSQDNNQKALLDKRGDNKVTDSFLLAGLHTCADLGPTMLRVFAQCPKAHALASVACCYMKMSCAVQNSLTKCKAQVKSGDYTQSREGLFSDGSGNVGKFQSYPPRKLFGSNERETSDNDDLRDHDVKLDCVKQDNVDPKELDVLNQDYGSTTDTQEGPKNHIPGFPMSEWVKGQEGCNLDFEPLELACHSSDVYYNRLKENDPNLIIQGYRALLEILIQKQNPSLVQEHAGLRLIKRTLGSIKKGHQIPFEEYAATALKKLGLENDPEACRELRENLLHLWPRLIAFHCVRLLLGPVMESLVLVDRMLYLLEQGIDSRLVPIFDPVISPRNFVLLATKR